MKIANQNLLVFPESSRSRADQVSGIKPSQNTDSITLPVDRNDRYSYPTSSPRGPFQQRAIDFYNITAEISKHAGEGELIRVDIYA